MLLTHIVDSRQKCTKSIYFINITDKEPDQSLKTAASKREVPIHSQLIKLGFLDGRKES